MAKIKKHGIDISSWQGNINLKLYKNQFVIIRAGYDVTKDIKAERNMDECERLGIPYGVYWYSYALNPTQALAEAKACYKVIKNRKIEVGVWFDMEDADQWKRRHGFSFTKSNITAICREFCNYFEAKDYYTGIYASRSWFDSYIRCDEFDKWVAQWGTNDGNINADTSDMGSLLQYTSVPLDKDLSYVDLKEFKNTKPIPLPTKKKLDVDGILGTQSVTALQKWMGTYVDGEITGQLRAQAKHYPALIAVSYGGGGSLCIKQLQNYLNGKGNKLSEDGIIGAQTVKALQRFLNDKNGDSLEVDGILGELTAEALQRHLNKVL